MKMNDYMNFDKHSHFQTLCEKLLNISRLDHLELTSLSKMLECNQKSNVRLAKLPFHNMFR